MNAEATGSNPVEFPEILFSGLLNNCLNSEHFICSSQFISFHVLFLSRDVELNKLAGSACVGLYSSASTALQRERRGHGFESRRIPEILFSGYFDNYLNCDTTSMITSLFCLEFRIVTHFLISQKSVRVWTFGYCCNLLHLKCKYEGVLVYSKIQTKNLLKYIL